MRGLGERWGRQERPGRFGWTRRPGAPARPGGAVAIAAVAALVVIPGTALALAATSTSSPAPAATPAPGGAADLTASVRSTPTAPGDGAPITYVGKVASQGPATTGRTMLALTLPAGATILTARGDDGVTCADERTRLACTGPGLAPGGSWQVTVIARVPGGAGGGNTRATVDVSSDLPDPTPADDTAATTDQAERSADLVVAATPPAGPVVAGTRVTVGGTVTNRGPSPAEDTVVTTVLPPGASFVSGTVTGGTCQAVGGQVDCALAAPLAVGASAPVAVVAALAPSFDAPDLLVSSAAVTRTPDPRPADDAAVTRTPVTAQAALDVAGAVAPALAAGAPTAYSVVVTNRGPSDARDVDLDPGIVGMTPVDVAASAGECGGGATRRCALGTVPAGASTRVRVMATVPADAPTGRLTMTPKVTSATPGATGTAAAPPVPAAPAVPATTTVARQADLAVSIATARSGGGLGPTTAAYTATVRNGGPSVGSPAVLQAIIPDGLTIGPVSAGCVVVGRQVSCPVPALPVGGASSATVETGIAPGLLVTPEPVRARVVPAAGAGGAAGATGDPQPANDTAVAAVGDTRGADLSVIAAAAPGAAGGAVVAGTRTTHVLTVSNAGPAVAPGVVVTDTPGPGLAPVDLPAGCTAVPGAVSCPVGDLAPGSARVVTLPLAVAPEAPTGTVTGTATARPAALVDPSDSNATATTSTPVRAVADLRTVLDRVEPGPVAAGGPPSTFRVRTTNVGPSVAPAAVVDLDALPRGLTVVGATVAGAPCMVTVSRAVCPVGDLPVGVTVEALVSVAVAADLPVGAVPVTAAASSMAVDPTPGAAAAELAAPVAAATDLQARVEADPLTTPYGTVVPGTRVALRTSAVNTGPSQSVGATLTTTLPAGSSVVSVLSNRGRCGATGARVDCPATDLGPGGTVAATIVVDVPTRAADAFAVRAVAGSPTADPTPADRVATLSLPVGDPVAVAGPAGAGAPGGPAAFLAGPAAFLGALLTGTPVPAIVAAVLALLLAVRGLLRAARARRREAAAVARAVDAVDAGSARTERFAAVTPSDGR
ncbi:DUF11 domain-containing protein [Actinomycetospora chiangmaiensis]|uniref:DUF11 domain-containing protein n=1 Tax=Actinomycetospora chiangmaiensis TaxID=402650 RepID=UPI00036279F8|nr:DUF11 domain-containing protein [Actinomycetospora chiangmaiensis]